MSGILGKKVGMTSIFDADGDNIVCTVVEAGPCVVTQIRTVEKDGYSAVQLAFGERSAKRVSKAMQGHFAAAKTGAKYHVVEFRDFDTTGLTLGDVLNASDIFEAGDDIVVSGTSKGKGFQGVVKRHGFKGVGMATHGQHNRARAPGSIGQSSDPSRVWKGMRMGGRMGGKRVTVKGLQVAQVLADQNLIIVTGAVPGHKKGLLEIRKAN